MNIAPVKSLLYTLELACERPALLIGSTDSVEMTMAFFQGFWSAASAYGYRSNREDYSRVVTQRGWESLSYGVVPQMQERGWDGEAMVNELLDIEIAILRDVLARLSEIVE